MIDLAALVRLMAYPAVRSLELTVQASTGEVFTVSVERTGQGNAGRELRAAAAEPDTPTVAHAVLPGAPFPRAARWLWVGDRGTVRVRLVSGTVAGLEHVPDGTPLRIAVVEVLTGTAARETVAFW